MNQPKEIPEQIKPYVFHGMKVECNGNEAVGDCPFCGGEGKFNINIETSKFRCWAGSCGESGNSATFLRKYAIFSQVSTLDADYREFAKRSNFAGIEGLKAFGVAKSPMNDKWIVPGYNAQLEISGIHKWTKIQDKKGKWIEKLLPTPGLGHHLFNGASFNPALPVIDLCEGWRDGIAWYETLASSEHETFNLSHRNVLSVPGTNSFKAAWAPLFAGKIVNILFDNDYPKVNKLTKETLEPAGVAGVKYVTSMLRACPTPPFEINFLAWGDSDQGHTETLPDGHDLRDFLNT